jgi:multidrug resistance efflux pump
MSNTDEKILKTLTALQADVTAIKDVQQKQGAQLETLEAGQKALQADVKGLHGKVDTVELKVEAIHMSVPKT